MSVDLEDCDCPKVVPIVDETDIWKGAFDGENGTHCLLGWCNGAFPNGTQCKEKAQILLKKEIFRTLKKNRRLKEPGEPHSTKFAWNNWYDVSIVTFNDNKGTKFSTLARIWNRVMAKMGYTIGNPEAGKKS